MQKPFPAYSLGRCESAAETPPLAGSQFRTRPRNQEAGSVLLAAFLTITILTLICATSLYITSQNQNAGMQTASWQQALAGAEMGVDTAIRALNTNTWGSPWNVQSYTGSLPNSSPPYNTLAPSPSPSIAAATSTPGAGTYNYRLLGNANSPYITFAGISPTASPTPPEGNTKLWGWVTVDTAGMGTDGNGQWYRIRSTGYAGTAGAGYVRSTNNRLDNDLRNSVGLRFDRKQFGSVAVPQAARTIEVVMQPLSTNGWARGVTLNNWVSMSGGGSVDSFDSSNPFKSTGGQYDVTKRQSHGDIGTKNSGTTSDLRSTYVYGNLSYSGTPVKNTGNVQGTISTPFAPTIPNVSAPTWGAGTYTSYGAGNPVTLTSGTKASPARFKISGDLTVSGGTSLTLVNNNGTTDNNYMEIWVTGKLTTSGSGYITQNSLVKVTWYVGNDITVSGSSYLNQSGLAANTTINGYGSNNKATISGSASFIGVLDAPNYDITISGGGSFVGALIADTLTISGGSGLHYDEALNTSAASAAIGNFAFASWFEDNSDPGRKDVNGNAIVY